MPKATFGHGLRLDMCGISVLYTTDILAPYGNTPYKAFQRVPFFTSFVAWNFSFRYCSCAAEQ